jgi:hypothetical protein
MIIVLKTTKVHTVSALTPNLVLLIKLPCTLFGWAGFFGRPATRDVKRTTITITIMIVIVARSKRS